MKSSSMTRARKITFNYNKDARIVEISLNFPKQADPSKTKVPALTNEENKLIKEKDCIPVLVKATLVKTPELFREKSPATINTKPTHPA